MTSLWLVTFVTAEFLFVQATVSARDIVSSMVIMIRMKSDGVHGFERAEA
jgi:hypothetical protein